jgi:hypothetical protein
MPKNQKVQVNNGSGCGLLIAALLVLFVVFNRGCYGDQASRYDEMLRAVSGKQVHDLEYEKRSP